VEILRQLGDLFLSAVPTVIIVYLFYLFLRWSFFKPMERVLTERHKRAEGAQQEAEVSRVAVQEKLRTYNEALRKARGDMFVSQEAARRQVLEEKQAAVHAARTSAQQELQLARQTLATEVAAVRTHLEQSSGDLAAEIAAAILSGEQGGPKIPAGGRAQ
jgi:F0F1-type ATP synthase membrane subunit b/b'